MAGLDDLSRGELTDILRRLRQLETASPLQNASIGSNGLRVYDGGVITIQNGGLNVTGSGTFVGTLNANGTITFTGTFNQSGPTTFTGDTKLNGPTHINGNTDVTGDFKVTGPTHLEGATDIKGTLSVEGATTLKGDMTLTTGKIKAGGMTVDPAADGGSVVFSGGGGLQGVSGVTVVKGAGNAGFTANATASMFAASNSVGVTSTAVTITGPTTVTGNLNANAAITNAGMPTTTIAANMYASGSNTFYKVTSAARFKVDPQHMDLPDSLLAVPVKDWWDKGEVERGEQKRRVPGVIAEEVEAAGGTAFVAYDDDGAIQGVAYDRYALARTEILARRLYEAEARIKELEDAA